MSKKLLAVTTSPRTKGNSDSALDLFLESVSGEFEIEKVRVRDLPFAPCRGCGYCEKEGICIQKDAFIPLMEKMAECDILVFASPVYAMSVCAQAKIAIDRCQTLWARKYLLKAATKRPEKRGVFIATAGQTMPNVFEHTVPVARFLFDVCGVLERNMQYILLAGLDKKKDFEESEISQKMVKDAAEVLITEYAAGDAKKM